MTEIDRTFLETWSNLGVIGKGNGGWFTLNIGEISIRFRGIENLKTKIIDEEEFRVNLLKECTKFDGNLIYTYRDLVINNERIRKYFPLFHWENYPGQIHFYNASKTDCLGILYPTYCIIYSEPLQSLLANYTYIFNRMRKLGRGRYAYFLTIETLNRFLLQK